MRHHRHQETPTEAAGRPQLVLCSTENAQGHVLGLPFGSPAGAPVPLLHPMRRHPQARQAWIPSEQKECSCLCFTDPLSFCGFKPMTPQHVMNMTGNGRWDTPCHMPCQFYMSHVLQPRPLPLVCQKSTKNAHLVIPASFV